MYIQKTENPIAIKRFIFENEKIEYVLEKIGCHSIKYHQQKNYWSCANHDGDNPTAINVKNSEYLDVKNWTRSAKFGAKADIITLVQYNQKCSFRDACNYLKSILGLSNNDISTLSKRDNFAKEKDGTSPITEEQKITPLDEKMLNDYLPLIFIDWYKKDGVMPWTRKKFGLLYSFKLQRIIIPLRHWQTGDLLGTNARTTVPDYELLGIKKYIITPSYPKRLNIYGLYENKEAIQKAGYVVVYEAEKSVLKRDSRADPTGVALSGHSLSDEQAKILIGLNVDIIISMDKDVPIQEVRFMCEKLWHSRNVYYTYDKWDLLGEKDSVADSPRKIFDFLMKYKVKYDEKEHQEYLKEFNNRR